MLLWILTDVNWNIMHRQRIQDRTFMHSFCALVWTCESWHITVVVEECNFSLHIAAVTCCPVPFKSSSDRPVATAWGKRRQLLPCFSTRSENIHAKNMHPHEQQYTNSHIDLHWKHCYGCTVVGLLTMSQLWNCAHLLMSRDLCLEIMTLWCFYNCASLTNITVDSWSVCISLHTLCISWYHGRIERHVAEKLLMESGDVDSFLVRESVTHPGDYTIAVRCYDNTIMSIRVDYKVTPSTCVTC